MQRKYEKHGHCLSQRQSPEYRTWHHMRSRCLWAAGPRYAEHGGRGIRVCPAWGSFTQFLADMGPRPSPKHSLDRVNNNGNYEPSNCRWATRAEQAQNRRDCSLTAALVLEARARHAAGEAVKPLARKMGVSYTTLYYAIHRASWKNLP